MFSLLAQHETAFFKTQTVARYTDRKSGTGLVIGLQVKSELFEKTTGTKSVPQSSCHILSSSLTWTEVGVGEMHHWDR